jgi:hypothetical protein
MIKNQIDNKRGFNVYMSVKILIILIAITIAIIVFVSAINKDWNVIYVLFRPFIAFIPLFLVFRLIDSALKPAYIETIINEKEIIIKTYNPNSHALRFIEVLKYKKYLKELRVNSQEYNDYKLEIGKFGLQKTLVFQKITKNGIYESPKLSISLLGQKKYTNLILSIDRLKGKINLN